MTFYDYLRVLREQWLTMMILVLLGIGGAIAVFVLRPVEYTAKLTMYVSTQGADTTQAAFQGAQLSQDRVASYTELLTGPRVTTDVIRKLNLSQTSDELARNMTATSKLDSVLLDVTVSDTSAQRATDIVNAVGEVFPELVGELERSTTPGAQPAVAVRVVQPALVPIRPSSTGLLTTLAGGLVIGLACGAAGAMARNSLDVRVKSSDQLRDITGTPNLGSIVFDPNAPKRPLIVREDPQSPRSEAFRQLRTNMQFIDVDRPRKVIVVTSAVPAEGKTTTVANLALAMSSAGNRVLVIEADLRLPKLSTVLGIDRTIGLTTVLAGRIQPENAVQSWGGGSFDILASGPIPPNPSEILASKYMRMLLEHLRERYETILIDSPPLLPVSDSAAIAPATDGAILLCRYKRTTRAQVQGAVRALQAVSVPILGTVLTMAPQARSRAYGQYRSYYHREHPAPLSSFSSSTDSYPLYPSVPPMRNGSHELVADDLEIGTTSFDRRS